MLELDCSILTPHDVLKTSGHVDRFSDLMCKDLVNGEIYRVDHLVEQELEMRLKTASSPERQEIESLLAQVGHSAHPSESCDFFFYEFV